MTKGAIAPLETRLAIDETWWQYQVVSFAGIRAGHAICPLQSGLFV
jgi:hypothetical protein